MSICLQIVSVGYIFWPWQPIQCKTVKLPICSLWIENLWVEALLSNPRTVFEGLWSCTVVSECLCLWCKIFFGSVKPEWLFLLSVKLSPCDFDMVVLSYHRVKPSFCVSVFCVSVTLSVPAQVIRVSYCSWFCALVILSVSAFSSVSNSISESYSHCVSGTGLKSNICICISV